ncbi:MAG TPA: transaldolase [Acidimicrobiales bacterium]|nr:transaldolase [Acidimicrobiales bacterium]
MTTSLHDLFTRCGQSPWLDNLSRDAVIDGTLAEWLDRGVRGVTSNPSIFQKAMTAGDAYDDQLRSLTEAGSSTEDAYWTMAADDIIAACGVLRGLFEQSGGNDGFVSLEVSPLLARDTAATVRDALGFHEQLGQPNLMVKIPATTEGVPAIRDVIAQGRNVNVTLIFSLERYAEVMEAYLTGLETRAAAGEDISGVRSVGSFFISRVDTEVDRRLDAIGSPEALALKGTAAVAQGKLAYDRFRQTFSGPRWEALAAKGACVQRPLWASTSTKNPALPDTLYVDTLIGPDTVNTMPEVTLEAFLDHGTAAHAVDKGLDDATATWSALGGVGVDLDDVARVLEDEGVAAFAKAYDELLTALDAKAETYRSR